MARPRLRLSLIAATIVVASCSSSSGVRDEFAALTSMTDDELDCVEELAEPDDPNPFRVMPDCMDTDRLRTVSSELVGEAVDAARESGELEEAEAVADEAGLDLEQYQDCLAEQVLTLGDQELLAAFEAPTSELLGERLAEPFLIRCVGIARDDPTLGLPAADLASTLSGAIGRVDARLQDVTPFESGGVRLFLIGDPDAPIVAIPESPVAGEALSVQVVLTGTRLADAALEVLGEQVGFDPPTATNLTVTGSRELTGGLVACVLEDPARVTIRPGPEPCDE